MIQFHQASLSFGITKALDHCDLTINEGEQVALIGTSGSGKSSLLKTIATEYMLDSGQYHWSGKDVHDLTAADIKRIRSDIAYIPQDLALVPNLRVSQNVSLGKVGKNSTLKTLCNLVKLSNKPLEEIHELLEQVGISEKMFHRTDSLSGGQQQRVAIARALYQNAVVMLADEPVSAVDPTRAHSLLECLTSVSSQHNMTLLCTLHNLEYAKKFFPRIVGMRAGKVVYDGTPQNFSEEAFNELYDLSYG